jgi:hypothetical protein
MEIQKKIAKNVDKFREKMLNFSRYRNLTSDFREINATWWEFSRKQYLLFKNAPACVIRPKKVKMRPAEKC